MTLQPFFPEDAIRPTDGPDFSVHSRYYALALEALLARLPDGFVEREPVLKAFTAACQQGLPVRDLVRIARPFLPPGADWPSLTSTCGFPEEDDPIVLFCHTWSVTAAQAACFDRSLMSARSFPFIKVVLVKDSRTSEAHLAFADMVYRVDDPGLKAFAVCRPWGCRCTTIAMMRTQLERSGLALSTDPFDVAAWTTDDFD